MKLLTTKEIAERLPDLMRTRKVNADQLADQVGISRQTIWRLQAGRTTGQGNHGMALDSVVKLTRWINLTEIDRQVIEIERGEMMPVIKRIIDRDERLTPSARQVIWDILRAGYETLTDCKVEI